LNAYPAGQSARKPAHCPAAAFMGKGTPRVALIGAQAMEPTKRNMRMKPGPIIFFIVFCIFGTVVGIMINNRYYAFEKQHEVGH
jgi:H+/Cl- antiporter ClcA